MILKIKLCLKYEKRLQHQICSVNIKQQINYESIKSDVITLKVASLLVSLNLAIVNGKNNFWHWERSAVGKIGMNACWAATLFSTNRKITRGLSNTTKLSVFKSVIVPILTYVHDFWVITERVLSHVHVQAAKMWLLRNVRGVTLREKVRSCETRKALNVERLLRIEISATIFRRLDQNVTGNIGVTSPVGYTQGKSAQRSSKDRGVGKGTLSHGFEI